MYQFRMYTGFCALTFACSCSPTPDRGVSDPGNAPQHDFAANETSLAYSASSDLLFCGYNDQAGAKMLVGPDTIANSLSNPTLAGLSYSKDRGLSWTRVGTLPPTPNCGDANCPTGLRGDPWLAADGQNVVYVNLAMTDPNPDFGDDATHTPGSPISGIAYAHSSNGGKSFLAPASVNFHLAAFVPGGLKGAVVVDKPSVDILGDVAVIAFDEPQVPGDQGIHFVTSVDGGLTFPISDALASDFPPGTPLLLRVGSPLVKLFSPSSGYIAYLANQIDNMDGSATASPEIARIDLTDPSNPALGWTATKVFALSVPTRFQNRVRGGQSREWRDVVPTSFAVGTAHINLIGGGSIDAPHLYYAFHEFDGTAAQDVVVLWDCIDALANGCAVQSSGEPGPAWRVRTFAPNLPQAQVGGPELQPSVAALRGTATVALEWYQGTTRALTLPIWNIGVFSTNGGDTFTPQSNLRAEFANSAYVPCPSFAGDAAGHSFGDYVGTIILPFALNRAGNPWLVTTSGYSNHCLARGNITDDQIIQALVW